ncbi:hypothetical protein [Sphaerobacter sp.]|uniref:hypothetical protein n=1 Tax=Sphaerobacter sp. TaxID=2099654 RepID=UPI001D358D84|nr:hypothetical protein [Sphaerobacter sp.]MBX5443625.1 hypothetical protein [Sphaerobacter sp.]
MNEQLPEPPNNEPAPSEPRRPSSSASRSIILIAVIAYLLLACMMATVALAIVYRVSSGR